MKWNKMRYISFIPKVRKLLCNSSQNIKHSLFKKGNAKILEGLNSLFYWVSVTKYTNAFCPAPRSARRVFSFSCLLHTKANTFYYIKLWVSESGFSFLLQYFLLWVQVVWGAFTLLILNAEEYNSSIEYIYKTTRRKKLNKVKMARWGGIKLELCVLFLLFCVWINIRESQHASIDWTHGHTHKRSHSNNKHNQLILFHYPAGAHC